MNRTIRISFLWMMLMLGLAIHIIMDLLPLLFGGSVCAPDATGETPSAIALMMAGFTYTLPFIGFLISLFGSNCRKWTVVALVLAIFMALFHLFHMAELFFCAGIAQYIVMPLNAITAILLVVDLYKKKKEQTDNR